MNFKLDDIEAFNLDHLLDKIISTSHLSNIKKLFYTIDENEEFTFDQAFYDEIVEISDRLTKERRK